MRAEALGGGVWAAFPPPPPRSCCRAPPPSAPPIYAAGLKENPCRPRAPKGWGRAGLWLQQREEEAPSWTLVWIRSQVLPLTLFGGGREATRAGSGLVLNCTAGQGAPSPSECRLVQPLCRRPQPVLPTPFLSIPPPPHRLNIVSHFLSGARSFFSPPFFGGGIGTS